MDITPSYPLLPANLEVQLPPPLADTPSQFFSGFNATPSALTANGGQLSINGQGETILIGAATDPTTGIGIFMGNDGAATKGYDFRVGDPSGNYLWWDASTATLTVKGVLTASAINIPDTTTANSFHVDTAGNAWWGATTLGSAVAKILNTGAATFSSITISGYALSTGGTFGGDGSDGALSLTSGTTTLSFASASYLLKNYTSVSITSTGKLAFSNPATNGSVFVMKSQGDVTLTASATIIDLSSMGATGATAVAGGTTNVAGNVGTGGAIVVFQTNGGGKGNGGGSNPDAGGAAPNSVLYASSFNSALNRYPLAVVGAGGGSGGINGSSGACTTGAGGRGGGALIVECAGAWNFTTASGISVAGGAGANAVFTSGANGAGGGGGGAAGFLWVLYKTLTANSGTVVLTGGTGGNGANAGGGQSQSGGSGGGCVTAGSTGISSTSNGVKTGGDGATGTSTIEANKSFA